VKGSKIDRYLVSEYVDDIIYEMCMVPAAKCASSLVLIDSILDSVVNILSIPDDLDIINQNYGDL